MAYTIQKVFSREDQAWKAALEANEDSGLVSPKSSKSRGIHDLQRVSSHVLSSNEADGSAEVVLEDDAEIDSTNHGDETGASNAGTPFDLGLSYVLNKVFSWENEESANNGNGGSSTEASPTSSNNATNNGRDLGLSYVLDKVFSWENGDDKSSSWNDPQTQQEVKRLVSNSPGEEETDDAVVSDSQNDWDEDENDEHFIGKRGGYKLRKFLSTPHERKSSPLAPSTLKRSPSHDHTSPNNASPLYSDQNNDLKGNNKNSPRKIRQILHLSGSPRNDGSHVKSPKEIDDSSTVAESVDSSTFAGDGSSLRGSKKGKLSHWKRIALGLACLLVAALGVAIFFSVGSNSFSDSSQLLLSESEEMEDKQNSETEEAYFHDDTDYPTVTPILLGPTNNFANSHTGSYSGTSSSDESVLDEEFSSPENDTKSNKDSTTKTATSLSNDDSNVVLYLTPNDEPTQISNSTTTSTATTTTNNDEANNSSFEEDGKSNSKVIFYLMADTPYSREERQVLMPKHIEEIGEDAEFLVHLGDLQYAVVDQCQEYAYMIPASILRKCKVPVFVLPGDNDINDCYDFDVGQAFWKKYFYKPDESWPHNFAPTRWGALDESFSFLHKGVLFFGLNIIGGYPASCSEWATRHAEHLSQMKSILNARSDEYEVVVIFGHAEPSSWHDDFFKGTSGLKKIIKKLGKPFVYFHGDWHEYYEVDRELGLDNFLRISLDGESIAPPIKIEIDVSSENPIKIDRRQAGLHVECCSDGWPRQ